jgi:hypothetical protein
MVLRLSYFDQMILWLILMDNQLDIENAPKGGVMDVYLQAVSKRLQEEVKSVVQSHHPSCGLVVDF